MSIVALITLSYTLTLIFLFILPQTSSPRNGKRKWNSLPAFYFNENRRNYSILKREEGSEFAFLCENRNPAPVLGFFWIFKIKKISNFLILTVRSKIEGLRLKSRFLLLSNNKKIEIFIKNHNFIPKNKKTL